jgi:plastocyanin
MTATRRHVLRIGGGILAGLVLPVVPVAESVVEIRMQGNANGSHVWFDPAGIRIRPGQIVRWINRDPGNSHTATAYHPRNSGRPLRIPEAAEPWDSDYLLPDETFSVTLTAEGVYDFFCIPHEHAGMVGRIVVGDPTRSPARSLSSDSPEAIPDPALRALPPVEEIMRNGIVRRV